MFMQGEIHQRGFGALPRHLDIRRINSGKREPESLQMTALNSRLQSPAFNGFEKQMWIFSDLMSFTPKCYFA